MKGIGDHKSMRKRTALLAVVVGGTEKSEDGERKANCFVLIYSILYRSGDFLLKQGCT